MCSYLYVQLSATSDLLCWKSISSITCVCRQVNVVSVLYIIITNAGPRMSSALKRIRHRYVRNCINIVLYFHIPYPQPNNYRFRNYLRHCSLHTRSLSSFVYCLFLSRVTQRSYGSSGVMQVINLYRNRVEEISAHTALLSEKYFHRQTSKKFTA